MEMNRTNHPGRRDAGLIEKIATVLLGLVILGYVAHTQGEHASPPAKAVAAVAVESSVANAVPPRAMDAEWLTHLSAAFDEERGAIAAPRECDLNKGIDTKCIFE